MDSISSRSPIFWIVALGVVVLVIRYARLWSRGRDDFPRIGPEPTSPDNRKYQTESSKMIEEGYSKYRDSVYKLWTIDMDRLIVPHKFMSELNKLPRSQVRLTSSERFVYTGMDICEESNLQYEVCAGPLSRNIGHLTQPTYDEILFALNKKLKTAPGGNLKGSYSLPLFFSTIDLITSATARVFVGPGLCRNEEWLATATGYTMDVSKASEELFTYPAIVRPIVVRFLKSHSQCRARFGVARRLLLPAFEERALSKGEEYEDMLKWLLDSARGRDAEPDRLVKRMLFLNMAAIHTTAITATNILLDLCARPEWMEALREEMLEAIEADGGIKPLTLRKLKKLDSFMRESRRLNTMGFLTFQRLLKTPLTLSNGTTLPKNSYLSVAYQPIMRDPDYYPDPLTFDPLRFYNLRKIEGEEDKHQFASVDPSEPLWTFGKFSCPGRHWAAAQVKLLVMVLLLEFEIGFPEGQTERPENKIVGGKIMPSITQTVTLRRRL